MATSTNKWRVFHRDLGELMVEADRYEQLGSGTHFYDSEGKQIASFADQSITTVLPDNVKAK